MATFPVPENEKKRLQVLREYELLDTAPDQDVDDITTLAASICDAPIALITLLDEHRQWFLSKKGINLEETPRNLAFCTHTILGKEMLVVEDATKDDRFKNNKLVTGPPHIRFYTGVPLTTPTGENLGSLCIIDRVPRSLSKTQSNAIEVLGRQVVKLFELRRSSSELAKALSELKTLKKVLPICSNCKKIRDKNGQWETVDEYLTRHEDIQVSHGMCDDCGHKLYPEDWVDEPYDPGISISE